MVSRIFEREINFWWDNHLDQFIAQQAELRRQKEKTIKDLVLFSDSASDTYEIFWGKFPEELYNWLRRLQTKTIKEKSRNINRKWPHKDLMMLHRLDTDLTRVVDFWVESTLEGYIVDFAAECYQYFSKA